MSERSEVREGDLLWEPAADARATTRMGRYLDRVAASRGLDLPDHAAAWAWSVDDLEGFWSSIVDEFDLVFHDPSSAVLDDAPMPGARWFPGATLNYAEHALRRRGPDPAIVARSQTREDVTLSWDELAEQVGRAAAGLRRLGVRQGDRVVGYVPNVPEAVVAFLACASIGAVWSSCAPEFGARSVVDRVRQIEPHVLITIDGYRYGDKQVDRAPEVARIRTQLPTLAATVVLPYLGDHIDPARFPDTMSWDELVEVHEPVRFSSVPFAHPLYVLFSSGTTGLPKAIVHGHGGILLEHVKMLGLHHDLGPGKRFSWFTTTGWMMWNYLVSGLAVDATIVLFDGDPAHPDPMTLWRFAADLRITVFGVGAPFLLSCRKAGLSPASELDLSALESVGSTGAPLPPEGFGWVYEHVGSDLLLTSASGGTDVCTAFVAGSPLLPVHAGEIPGRCLGAPVEAFDPEGRPVIGERGELVLTRPMPSMPVGFWGDPDGTAYRRAYFERFPGVWHHGDWIRITERGSCVISGRSDATLNRGGVRMGTAEFYSVVEAVDEVRDSLVVHLDTAAGEPGELVLFVALDADAGDAESDDAAAPAGSQAAAAPQELSDRLAAAIRSELSPRHVPDRLHVVPAIPRTISGKKMEVPVKRLLEGEPLARVVNPGAMADPEALEPFLELADRGDG